MNKIIKPAEMVEAMMQILEDVVKEYSDDKREQAKANILGAFGSMMFGESNE
jgi:hypothetical protein